MPEPGRPIPPPPPPPPPPPSMPPVYYPQPLPAFPAMAPYVRTDGRAAWGLVLALVGLAVGLIGLLAGAVILVFAGGDLTSNYALGAPALNGFGIGIPALGLGPAAYFMGRSALGRIKESQGKLGGSPAAQAAAWIGVATTIAGALSTLLWLVITLLAVFGPPPG